MTSAHWPGIITADSPLAVPPPRPALVGTVPGLPLLSGDDHAINTAKPYVTPPRRYVYVGPRRGLILQALTEVDQ